MRSRAKYIYIVEILLCMLLLLAGTHMVYADDVTADEPVDTPVIGGVCGEDMTWTLSEDGTILLEGSGAMYDYASSYQVPWYSYRMSIKKVVLDLAEDANGQVHIGDHAFHGYPTIREIVFKEDASYTELTFGEHAFCGCSSLEEVSLPPGTTVLAYHAFAKCYSLSKLTLPDSLPEENIDRLAFENNWYMTIHAYEGSGAIAFAKAKNIPCVSMIRLKKRHVYEATDGNYYRIMNDYSCQLFEYNGTEDEIILPGDVEFEVDEEIEVPNPNLELYDMLWYDGATLADATTIDGQRLGDLIAQNNGIDGLEDVILSDGTRLGDIITWDDREITLSAVDGDPYYTYTTANGGSVRAVLPVSCIYAEAFAESVVKSYATSLYISDSVVEAGNGTFADFSALVNVHSFGGIVSVPEKCFEGCLRLRNWNGSENIPLQSVGSNAFKNCSMLENLNLPGNVDSGEVAFAADSLAGCPRKMSISDGSGQVKTALEMHLVEPGKTTALLSAKSVIYNKKCQEIGPATVTGSSGAVTYTYYRDAACTTKTTATSNGAAKKGGAPKLAGVYYVQASVAADDEYVAAKSNVVKFQIKPATHTISIKTKTKTLSKTDLKAKAKSFSLGVQPSEVDETFTYAKVSGSSKLSVKEGRIIMAKGTKAGTYGIKVKITGKLTKTAAKNYTERIAAKTFTIKVTVK